MRETEFNHIYASYAQPLYNYAVWLTGNRQASDDILQTVFMRVWRSGSVPDNGRACKAWLYTICRNACMDFFRARRRSIRFRLSYERERPGCHESGAEERLIWRQLQRLGEIDRSIVYLHVKMGWSYADIASLHAMTENNVRVRAFRAFRRLRKLYAESET